jgi:ribosomal protein S12 methylthiotransferase
LSKKIGVVSLGCPKNLVDTEIMLGALKGSYQISTDIDNSDVIIVNTCGFIDSAKEESINTILEMCNYKEKDKNKKVIVTGCLAQRYKDEILDEIPEVDGVVGVGNYHKIVEIIEETSKNEKVIYDGDFSTVDYLSLEREVSTGQNFAYLKIAEGCNNNCTYCIIPKLRGNYLSRKLEDIVEEAKKIAQKGIKELILVAQDTTLYGSDLYGQPKIVQLIRELSKIEEIKWIRILYAYPEQITDELIEEIAVNQKVCKYIDIPIQHASDKILKAMGRKGDHETIKNVITKLKDKVKDIIIRTTFIVGFPGENEEDINILKDFTKEMEFDRLGVFTYSQEEGTPAAKMENQIDESIKEKRAKEILEMQQEIAIEKNNNRIHKIYDVIVEGVADDGIFYYGRSYGEAPDIDNIVYFTSEEPLESNGFVKVEILNIDNYDLVGRRVDEFTK